MHGYRGGSKPLDLVFAAGPVGFIAKGLPDYLATVERTGQHVVTDTSGFEQRSTESLDARSLSQGRSDSCFRGAPASDRGLNPASTGKEPR